MPRLIFHGAAREVTGSMHVLEVDGSQIALDCGLFQGRRAEAAAKNADFPFDPRRLHAVVLSHAHIDHAGRLPLLARRGFEGVIYATPAARDLAAVMLADSAHIQSEDAVYLNKKRARRGEPPVEPLYTDDDAAEAVRRFRTVSYDLPFSVAPGVEARFHEAGHMLGSAGLELVIRLSSRPETRVVFSGDIGRFGQPILRDPAPLPACDALICESTYGNRATPPVRDLAGQLAEVVHETVDRAGKIVVPAFSVGRTQTIVYYLHRLMVEGRIPRIPVFVDSPLAIDATDVFRMHPECYDREARELLQRAGDLLGAGCCTFVREVERSKALQRRRSPCVIISASGMCETGRILHHLKNNVQNPRNTVLIVGYQAAHTLGRRIVERQSHLKIFGTKYRLRAQVVVLNGFSAHADRNELDRLTAPLAGRCRRVFLVHGEPDQMDPFAARLRQAGFRSVQTPSAGDAFEI